MCAGPNCVCSGMGGLFRAVFSEPAGPPFVLAELLHYNGLQEPDLESFEAILKIFYLQLFNTEVTAPNPNITCCFYTNFSTTFTHVDHLTLFVDYCLLPVFDPNMVNTEETF